ncbi:MAG: multiple sugar transport system ATP-binding protein [Thermomicrobiales bacterium]|nr:multiple sugar transport system ATP-binding protein [Thermomicrobiales bacterium]
MARVEFVDVSKRYGEAGAVNGASLTVEDHEFLVLLGPSGCGKSTLLKMVAGLEDVTEGEIYIEDRLVNYVRPAERNVAMVFQNYALYPHMTVYDNIAFPLKMTGVPKQQIRERTLRAAGALGLEPFLERRPEHLSGGQRQRVALGRAIVREPAVFLMDEPLSNLDAQLRVQTREELLKLHARLQTTTIYVTHDQIEAMTMGHRIVVMRSGVIQQVGKPQDVYDNPVNTFVAAFLGSPRINLHTGRLRAEGDALLFANEDVTIPLPDRLVRQARAAVVDGETALGVRPEDIAVDLNGRVSVGESVRLSATVALVEPVGSDLYVNATTGGATWMARTDPRLPVIPGQQVGLVLNLANAKLFGADGRNLAVAS